MLILLNSCFKKWCLPHVFLFWYAFILFCFNPKKYRQQMMLSVCNSYESKSLSYTYGQCTLFRKN